MRTGEATPGRTTRRRLAVLAGTVAVLGIVGGLVWGGTVVWRISDEFSSMARTEIPGEVAPEIDEAGEQVVYYERQSLVALPIDPDIEVSVTGPDGASVETESTTRMQYRAFRTVRQAHAAFTASEPGIYSVTVDGHGEARDAVVAVGPRLTASSTIGALAGPAVVLFVGILAAGGLAVVGRRRAQHEPHRQGASDDTSD